MAKYKYSASLPLDDILGVLDWLNEAREKAYAMHQKTTRDTTHTTTVKPSRDSEPSPHISERERSIRVGNWRLIQEMKRKR